MRVVILEDNAEREEAMRACVADKFPAFSVEVFKAVRPFIERLSESGLYDVALISLDHDLEMIETADGRLLDPGTGVDAAGWLSTQPAITPVIVHTTNAAGGEQMVELLANGGWNLHKIVPYGDMEWIREHWRSVMRNMVVASVSDLDLSFHGVQISNCRLRHSRSVEWHLSELLKAANAAIKSDDSLCLELGYSDRKGNWCGIAGAGVPVLRDYFGGTRFEFLEEIAASQADSGGPVDVDCVKIGIDWTNELRRHGVRVLQAFGVRVQDAQDAVLFVAGTNQNVLSTLQTQSKLRHLVSLLSMAFLIEAMIERLANSDHDAPRQDALTDFPK